MVQLDDKAEIIIEGKEMPLRRIFAILLFAIQAVSRAKENTTLLPYLVLLGNNSAAMCGTTPPWEMTTSPNSRFNLREGSH